ncbi:helix-turn-helix transcriptional regulator [Allonocardiopsis opalescens]|uniref:Transcriptional regulator n=1 Tax=Allonocardiopsis opalescens TaxID=1144618 RepID=A0A2T0PTW6_9ACTN|nr:WYL domain-containing protein [Allonocardiopsis opalescens]PRX92342.1 transcriptional regulator [Allonocardiopsis opalescens]
MASGDKTERLLNLVFCLLSTRRFLSAEQIREIVPGYPASDSAETFKRKFERDKADLRAIGIQLEYGSHDPWADDTEKGYRISRSGYELPPIELEPDEAAVLGLAARAWQHAALGRAASGALLKLRAAGVLVDDTPVAGIMPVLDTDEPTFPQLWQAVRERRPVTFDYLAPGRTAPQRRALEPWGVVHRLGRWYVVGHDRDRGAPRVFRLGRIVGEVRPAGRADSVRVPEGVDVRELVRDTERERARVARLRLRDGSGWEIRRQSAVVAEGRDGWDEVDFPYASDSWLAGYVASFADNAEVVGPESARRAVAEHLRAIAAGGAGPSEEPAVREAVRKALAEPEAEQAAEARPRQAVTAEQRLARLLTMVPYVLDRQGVSLRDLGETFQVSEKELIKDLNLLWMCGLPGHTPGDLVEVSWEGGQVMIGNADTIAAPLRLAADEAAALLVALQMLADIPEVSDHGALDRIRAKLRAAAGVEAGELAAMVEVRVAAPAEALAPVQRALREGRALHLTYHVPSRDELTERDVDPIVLSLRDGHTYLQGWCRSASDVRLFRLDRMAGVRVLDEPARVPAHARRLDLSHGALQTSPGDEIALLELRPEGGWVLEEYDCAVVAELGEGRSLVRVRTPDRRWVRRLALRLGARARVHHPGQLAKEVRADAERALARYEPDTGAPPDRPVPAVG